MFQILAAIGSSIISAYIWWRVASHLKHYRGHTIVNHLFGILLIPWVVPPYLITLEGLRKGDSVVAGVGGAIFAILVAIVIKQTPSARWRRKNTPRSQPKMKPAERKPEILKPFDSLPSKIRFDLNDASLGLGEFVTVHPDYKPLPTHVEFPYLNESGQRSLRKVDVHLVDEDYFTGYCHHRQAEHTFRFDRIEGDHVIDCVTNEMIDLMQWKRLLQYEL